MTFRGQQIRVESEDNKNTKIFIECSQLCLDMAAIANPATAVFSHSVRGLRAGVNVCRALGGGWMAKNGSDCDLLIESCMNLLKLGLQTASLVGAIAVVGTLALPEAGLTIAATAAIMLTHCIFSSLLSFACEKLTNKIVDDVTGSHTMTNSGVLEYFRGKQPGGGFDPL